MFVRFLSFILTLLITTPMVLARTTEVSAYQEISDEHSFKDLVFSRLDKVTGTNDSDSLEKVIQKYERKIDRAFNRSKSEVQSLLNQPKRLNKLFQKQKDLSYDEFINELEESISDNKLAELKLALRDGITQSGSVKQFIKDAKAKLQNEDGNSRSPAQLVITISFAAILTVLAIIAGIIVIALFIFLIVGCITDFCQY